MGIQFGQLRLLSKAARGRQKTRSSKLKAETKRPCDRVGTVMIPRNLAIITNGGPDSAGDLDANVGVNEKRVVSQVWPAKVCRRSTQCWSRNCEGENRILELMLPGKP